MIHIYDGNNVMLRAMSKQLLPSEKPMSMRMRYHTTLAAPLHTQIWVWDGYDHNRRRKEIYPAYKANRTPMAEDMFAQIKLWRELLTLSPGIQIECKGWEADDVIRQFAGRGTDVTIHTNDLDYAQLEEMPNVTLNGVRKPNSALTARWIPLYKATRGDPSDNISGIPGFGPKAWDNLGDHWAQFERAIVAGDPAGFVGLPVTKSVANWLLDPDNIAELQNMLLITHFHTVPDDELNAGITVGQTDIPQGEALLSRYFL
jgi:hypothetical protein